MEMTINERGYWEGVDKSKHLYDEPLAHSILHLVIQKQYTDVIDIGCGDGSYTSFLNDNGVSCAGYDGNPNTPEMSHNTCSVMDFSQKVDLLRPVDLILCLEVGEHVPEKYESILLDNITSLAKKKIIISWAVPGQDGFGHFNCRSNDYVVKKVERKGFRYDYNDTVFLRTRTYRSWFKDTLMVFNKK